MLGAEAVLLLTVTPTELLVAELLDVSVAIARMECEPLLTLVESQAKL